MKPKLFYIFIFICSSFSLLGQNLPTEFTYNEFLGYVKNAKYVITGTFHGSVFSILMKKNFVVYLNNGNKILDLLSDYHLENRIVQSNNSIEEILQTKIDYDEVYKLLDDNKMQSVTYIKNAMNKE